MPPGKVLFEGQWLDKAAVANILELRKKQEEVNRLRQQGDKIAFADQLAEALLKKSAAGYKTKAAQIIPELADFISRYPQSSRLKEISAEMNFLKYFNGAVHEEKLKNITGAVLLYKKAVKLKPLAELKEKISKLEKVDIGL